MKNDNIQTIKNGPKIRHIMNNIFTAPFKIIKLLLNLPDIHYEDIMILAPSIKFDSSGINNIINNVELGKNKKQNPCVVLANLLTRHNIPIFVPTSEETVITQSVVKHKILITTFHQSKGLERKMVLLLGFDESYYKFYAKNADKNKCPNPLYVALTRASKQLFLFQSNQFNFLSYCNEQWIRDNCYLFWKNYKKIIIKEKDKIKDYSPDFGVTNFIQYLPTDIILAAMSFLKINEICAPTDFLAPKSIILQSTSLYELVYDITGNAIPAYYEFITTGKMTLYQQYKRHKHNKPYLVSEQQWKKLQKKCTIEYLLKLANFNSAYNSKYKYRTVQINRYNWISKEMLKEYCKRLQKVLPQQSKLIFEKAYYYSFEYKNTISNLIGSLDCIDETNKTVWEIKCVAALQNIHIIQLALYMLLHKNNNKQQYSYKLFNVFDNSIIEISAPLFKLKEMCKFIMYCKDCINQHKKIQHNLPLSTFLISSTILKNSKHITLEHLF
jgi:hypothetical protein